MATSFPSHSQPRLRGVSHQLAFVASLAAGAFLIASAGSTRATLSAAVFAVSVAVMFGASAAYHRISWKPGVKGWIRRVDHAGIYLVIAGTYTPYAFIVLSGITQTVVLALVWAGVTVSIGMRFIWPTAPTWIAVGLGLGLGWLSLIALPQLLEHLPFPGLLLLLTGGLLYTTGAIVYGLRWPDPRPAVFGFHEVFHAFVIAAVVSQYASIAFFVLPHA
jgi:hemolysin III